MFHPKGTQIKYIGFYQRRARTAKRTKERRKTAREKSGNPGPSWVGKTGRVHHALYIKSSQWRRVRERILKRDQWVCRWCGKQAEQVHHIHYRTLGYEKGDELVSLCARCHEQEHAIHPVLSEREAFWSEVISTNVIPMAEIDVEYREIMRG